MINKTTKTKFPGFTISEIIISLMLSAILISLVVKLFEYFLEIHRDNDKNLSNYEEILNFELLLNKSMAEADIVYFFPKSAELKFSKNGFEIFLSFSDSNIVYRNYEQVDTFFIKTSGIVGVYHTLAPSMLVSLSFNALHPKHIIALKFMKEYDGETIVKSQLMNYEN